jgi:hypothetical protein
MMHDTVIVNTKNEIESYIPNNYPKLEINISKWGSVIIHTTDVYHSLQIVLCLKRTYSQGRDLTILLICIDMINV